MPKWGINSWLVVVRSLQVLGMLISAVLNGFLLVYIHLNRLGLSGTMLALEVMVSIRCVASICIVVIDKMARHVLPWSTLPLYY